MTVSDNRAMCPCGKERVAGRGLGTRCYEAARAAGKLLDHPRTYRTNEETMEEWALLHSDGLTLYQAAERLGIKPDSLWRAIRRHDLRVQGQVAA